MARAFAGGLRIEKKYVGEGGRFRGGQGGAVVVVVAAVLVVVAAVLIREEGIEGPSYDLRDGRGG
jgi:hypothetical protein